MDDKDKQKLEHMAEYLDLVIPGIFEILMRNGLTTDKEISGILGYATEEEIEEFAKRVNEAN